MADFFYWSGVALWGIVALYLALAMLTSFIAAFSYYTMCVIAVIRHRRHRLARWHRLPWEFLCTWWKFLMHGQPDSISSQYARWEGPFKWSVSPRTTKPEQADTGEAK